MPRDPHVFCLHCQCFIPRTRERAHRRRQQAPFQSPAPPIPSRLRRVFNVIEPDQVADTPANLHQSEDSQSQLNYEDIPAGAVAPACVGAIQAAQSSIFAKWDTTFTAASDSEDEESGNDIASHPEIGDCDAFDWDRFDAGNGLSAWDHLGEGFEEDAAKIANKLCEYDLAICRAFAYKVQTHTTDEDFLKLPYAFPNDPPLPRIDKLRSRIAFLSGFQPEQYDCCPKGCCCYTGPHAELSKCPYCSEARYRPDGKARRKYTHIPIIPRLISLVGNRRIAEQMQYRSRDHHHTPGKVHDVFDGTHYRSLLRQHVQLDGQKLSHKYFEDHRDIALGMSADGFSPFKKRKASAWAFILFNYNLPPDVRFHVENILAVGVVGPKKPVDPDSFLWPAVQELLRLMVGVRAFDGLTSLVFCLRAFLILVFGDMPAVALLMHMKNHNAILPCRMCKIVGLRIPGSRATTHYVPLDRSRHPDVRSNPSAVKVFDPDDLPMRTHEEVYAQGDEVQMTVTNTSADALSKRYGVKGVSIFFHLSSISFPISFPFDFMHLVWENLAENLVLLWTGNFKGLNQGTESYELQETVWNAIGKATVESGSYIPSAYGSRLTDIAKDRSYYSAEMWSFWVTFLGPVLLRRRFQRPKYYAHFISLVRLLNICLQFELTTQEIEEVRRGFIQWVKEFERHVRIHTTHLVLTVFVISIYYQYNPERLSCCPLTIHALLHMADCIKATGPVWCYWAFPMERYCGILRRGIRSRRFPYASLSRYVTETAQLSQIATIYDIASTLALRPPPTVNGILFSQYPSCVLLPPKSCTRPAENLMTGIASALATRFDVNVQLVKKCLKNADVEEWGKVRRVDSDSGDTMHASSMIAFRDDTRNATYVRYEMLVDKYARQARRRPEYQLQTFYGQLQHIYVIQFRSACPDLGLNHATTVILAAIRSCIINNVDSLLDTLDIRFYSKEGPVHVIDITSLQCLVGRVPDRNKWAIIDRSRALARALYVEDDRD